MSDPFRSSRDDTHAQMVQATYEALRKYGYTELTIQQIGDEFPKSKSLIYQHYEGKDELLVDFLEFMLDHFESMVDEEQPINADERLRAFVDHLLPLEMDEDLDSFTRAMIALHGQAAHDERFRKRFTKTDRAFRSHIAKIVREGIKSGTFHDADPERIAEFVVTTTQGAMLRRSTTNESVDITAVRRELDEYLRLKLGLESESLLNRPSRKR